MGWNPFNKAKDAVKKIINPAVDGGKRAIQSVENKAVGHVKWVENEAVKRIPKEVEKVATKEVPKVLERMAKEIAELSAERAVKEALENAVDIIELGSPNVFTLVFGMELALVVQGEVTVAVAIPNPVSKINIIKKWAKNAPSGRSQIIQCVKDFGPSSLTVEFKISGNGVSAEWDGEDKYDKLDKFLEKHGV